MAVTTDDCRKFLVDFFKVHSHMVVELFEGDPDNPAEEYPGQIASMITKSKNWKRRYKCKPGSETGYCCNSDECEIYTPTGRTTEPRTNFVWERGFDCDGFEGQVSYIVLERPDGTLALGEYIGD